MAKKAKKRVNKRPAETPPAPARTRAKKKPASFALRVDLFAADFARYGNAKQAAIVAGYSEKTAKQQGSRLLTHVDVKAAIAREKQKRMEQIRLNADGLRSRIEEVLDADEADLFNENGTMKDLSELPATWRKGMIRKVKIVELLGDDPAGGEGAKKVIGFTKEVTFTDRARFVKMLGDHRDVSAFKEMKGPGKDSDNPLLEWRKRMSGKRIQPRPDAGEPAKKPL